MNSNKKMMQFRKVLYKMYVWRSQFKGTLENYPIQPPEYIWKGIGKQKFYHMNVYSTGKTCIDILDNSYSYTASKSVLEILAALEGLLYDPNPKSPTDVCQAGLYQFYYSKYERNVKQFVKDYMNTQT